MVFQLVKKYKGQREKHVQLFTLKEISKQILTTVNHLQHKSNDVVIEFFVEECKKMKERLLDMLRNDEKMILVKTSQWQGEHATGEILTLKEVEEHLEELGRNVDEYMEQIKKL